jgi:predicted nucleic acid-binding protein
VEPSVWNYLFAHHLAEKKALTHHFFQTARHAHKVYISPLVFDELEATPDEEHRRELLDALDDQDALLLAPNPKVVEVSREILDLDILTKRSENDAIHIAYAIVHGMDALVSWDTGHIVRLKTRRGVSAVCRLLGYREVELVTPEEI